MPATSKRQARFMAMVAHDPAAAKRVGVSQDVGKEFATSSSRYKSLPESKGGSVAKKKGWLKGSKGEKKLKSKLSEPKKKSEEEKLISRYGQK